MASQADRIVIPDDLSDRLLRVGDVEAMGIVTRVAGEGPGMALGVNALGVVVGDPGDGELLVGGVGPMAVEAVEVVLARAGRVWVDLLADDVTDPADQLAVIRMGEELRIDPVVDPLFPKKAVQVVFDEVCGERGKRRRSGVDHDIPVFVVKDKGDDIVKL